MSTPAGEFRRGCELVSNLALVAVDPLRLGDTTIMTSGELSVHVAAPVRYGIALLLATGSNRHIEALITLARQQGMTSMARRFQR